MPLRTVMAPQLSQAGASDWKSANSSLRAVFGPSAPFTSDAGAGQDLGADVGRGLRVSVAVGVNGRCYGH